MLSDISAENQDRIFSLQSLQLTLNMLLYSLDTTLPIGAGISAENQQRLFKEIIQFNPEKLQAGGGSG